MKQRNLFLLVLSEALLGIGIFFFYVYHVRMVFETRTNFGHLSKLSRESLFRKEDALYFSYYKTIVEAETFWHGYNKLLNTTTVEYPIGINIVERFHILPEITISFLYHTFKDISHSFGIPIMSCWTTDKFNNNDPLIICEGFGEPFYFYLEFVWIFGGFTVFILYVYASFLSETVFGGIYAVVLYIIFHKNTAKIYERPAARENFAFPFIFWQMLYLSLCIARAAKSSQTPTINRCISIAKLTVLTVISLLCWQFSSIIYATQILIMIASWSLGLVSNNFSIDYTISQFLSNILAYFLSYENKKYLLSWQNGPALTLLFISVVRLYKARMRHQAPESYFKNVTLGVLLSFSLQGTINDVMEKTGYATNYDNPYTVYRDLVLHWGLQRKANFTTTLLSCNPDFTEVKFQNLWELLKVLFVKPYCLYGVVVLAKFLRKLRRKETAESSAMQIERACKYVLEDFLEENRISMQEMSNKETEKDFVDCLKLLEECEYDYEKYKQEKCRLKKEKISDRDNFINDVKKLKDQISANEKKKERDHTKENKTENTQKIKDTNPVEASSSRNEQSDSTPSERTPNKQQKSDHATRSAPKKDSWSEFNYHYFYNLAQLVMFSLIGISIKKLFFLCYTQGCVIAPTLCSKFWYKKHNNVFWHISLAVFLTSIIDPGFQNVKEEYLSMQKDNDDLEVMLDWINTNTDKDAVFGGPIEIIGTVHLSTRRPIVNHPHLEMRQICDRTETIYSVYSRQQSSEIYNQCSQIKLQYLILSREACTNSAENECDFLAIWDDIHFSQRKNPQFCSELDNKHIPSFLKVFSTKNYGIIKMFSQSVQINFKYKKMQEEII